MSQPDLTVKLRQLDCRLTRLRSCIDRSAAMGPEALRAEIAMMRLTCQEASQATSRMLHRSRAPVTKVLSSAYDAVEQIVRGVRKQLPTDSDPEAGSEEKLLLAEYALDFAAQSAERALLLSLEAMESAERLQSAQKEGVSQ